MTETKREARQRRYMEGLQRRDATVIEQRRAYLWPGETLMGEFPMLLDVLVPDRPPRRYRTEKPGAPKKPRPKGFWVLYPVYWVMWLGAVPAGLLEMSVEGTWRGFRRIFRGQVWSGGWESGAGHFIRAVRAGSPLVDGYGHTHYTLTLTDRRLLLTDQPSTMGDNPAPVQLLAEIPRGHFARRREPHPRRHTDRVDIAFPDGSWVALEAGRGQPVEHIASLLG
ncbi:hypothetical protein [Streptomyces sp. NBC_01465]|uniref:hypothetical protein n=1 Tax=Streptomyces sp. NBC_01465 TaxID=2903878 RepID=UPI002E339DC5|nr:hypothetical protein [Streptomyces sp. NBC_01465]